LSSADNRRQARFFLALYHSDKERLGHILHLLVIRFCNDSGQWAKLARERTVAITSREKLNLKRFGCSLRERTGVFLIDWNGKRAAAALSADIFARLACVGTATGPIVLLALEISVVRPLPRYCYFPFDLNNKNHRESLLRLTSTGEVRLSLLNGKQLYKRTHQLGPYLQTRASEIYAESLQAFESFDPTVYDFNRGLQLLERYYRVPELLNRVLLSDTLRDISERIQAAIKDVPNENRELAKDIVRAATEAFSPYYQSHGKAFLDTLRALHFGATCTIDIHREFTGDSDGLTKFLSGLLATLSAQELNSLAELLGVVVASTKLPFKELAQPKSQPTAELTHAIPELPVGLKSLVERMGASGISKETPGKFFRLIGLEVGGKPGRPTKDYSQEYELKKKLSWTKVARQSLRENADIREEFGGRTFDSLGFEEQENLKNRIREGVRSYAERTGKSFPIEAADSARDEDPAEN
jgi:hypothetical protein